ncbi:O-antigen ligase family protein [Nitrospira calida]|jgi:probable O-glycosylation ligase (exosortase A-associated)
MRIFVLFLTYYGCALYGYFNPVLGVLFFVHITILRPESLVWGNPAFGRLHLITASLSLGGYLIHRETLKRQSQVEDRYQTRYAYLFLVYIVWLYVVTFLAEASFERSLEKTLDMTKIFALCFLLTKTLTTKERFEQYVLVISVSFGLLGFWGFLQGVSGNPRLDDLWPGGSSQISAALVLVIPLVLARAMDPKLAKAFKLGLIGCAAAIVLCLLYTASRGGFLGLVGAGGTFFLLMRQRTKALIFSAAVAAAVVIWQPETYRERIATIFVPEEQRDASSQSRIVLWNIALRIWQDHMIAGVGLNNFSPVKETYVDKVSDLVQDPVMYNIIFGKERLPHGVYTGMLAESGLVGLVLFLCIVLRSLVFRVPSAFTLDERFRNLHFQMRGAQAGLVGFLIAGLFADLQYIEFFYVHLFFIGALRAYANRIGELEREKGAQTLTPESRTILQLAHESG